MFDPRTTRIAAAKKLGFDQHFYGLGEKAARLDKRRGHFTMWNADTPGYGEGTDPIYQSIPFYLGWRNGETYGVFFDNSYRTQFDFGQSTQEYAAFSGSPVSSSRCPAGCALPRHSYMQGYRLFTWDTSRYPNPKAFTQNLRWQGVKVVTIVDPGAKYQPTEPGVDTATRTPNPELAPQGKSYYVFNQGLAQNYFLKRKSGQLYVGKVWPGESVFTDYTLEAARRWWGDLHRALIDNGVAGIWNDMNEPSDFVDQTDKSQMDVVNFDEGEYSTHVKNRNVFGSLMAWTTREGLERLQSDKTPFRRTPVSSAKSTNGF